MAAHGRAIRRLVRACANVEEPGKRKNSRCKVGWRLDTFGGVGDARPKPGLAAALRSERHELATTFRAVGPEADTLIKGWTAWDLAAHVAATEQQRGVPTFVGRTVVVRYGWRLNDTFRPVMAMDLRRIRRHGFHWAVQRLERPGPRLLERSTVVPVSVFEMFVHHEDVRRANDLERSIPVPDLVPSILWLLRYHRRLLADISVLVRLPDGTQLSSSEGTASVTVKGQPEEVLLWLAGRHDGVTVDVDATEQDRSILERLHI